MAYITTDGRVIKTSERRSHIDGEGRLSPIQGDDESDEELDERWETEIKRRKEYGL